MTSISLVVGGIALMNVMLLAVTERRRELGEALNGEDRPSELSRRVRQLPALLRPLSCEAKSRPYSQDDSKA